MPKMQSLDEFIAKKAAEFADHVKGAAALADNEEEIRIEVETQLAFIKQAAGIDFEHIKGKHEYTVAKGRIDSLYSRVLIEYKNPSDPGARLGPRLDSPGSKKVVDQIKSRFRGPVRAFRENTSSFFRTCSLSVLLYTVRTQPRLNGWSSDGYDIDFGQIQRSIKQDPCRGSARSRMVSIRTFLSSSLGP